MVAEPAPIVGFYQPRHAQSRRYFICKKRRFWETFNLCVEQILQCGVESRSVVAAVVNALSHSEYVMKAERLWKLLTPVSAGLLLLESAV